MPYKVKSNYKTIEINFIEGAIVDFGENKS